MIKRFLDLVDKEKGVVSVHCKAGLGRTGVLRNLLFCFQNCDRHPFSRPRQRIRVGCIEVRFGPFVDLRHSLSHGLSSQRVDRALAALGRDALARSLG